MRGSSESRNENRPALYLLYQEQKGNRKNVTLWVGRNNEITEIYKVPIDQCGKQVEGHTSCFDRFSLIYSICVFIFGCCKNPLKVFAGGTGTVLSMAMKTTLCCSFLSRSFIKRGGPVYCLFLGLHFTCPRFHRYCRISRTMVVEGMKVPDKRRGMYVKRI